MQCFRLVILLVFFVIPQPVPAWKGDIVKTWARSLGEELWKLSESLTQSADIRSKYTLMNASVKRKNGKQILESSLKSVSTMLTRKIKAVKCIHASAQKLAEEFNDTITEDNDFEYCSAKYSKFQYEDLTDNSNEEDNIPKFAMNNSNYLEVQLEKDSHFYDISVNTNISCVHVPTNIYYKEKSALNDILWSKGLNEIFINNYKSDPSLAWQYFGSSHGILRFYPGMPWNNRKVVDTYDCRVQSWYIEAATCSKDVIILFDISGSMTGFKNYVARRTLRSLLDTLSNNDYVNVYTFKNETSLVVECFVGLVQATPENLKTITDTLEPTDEPTGDKKRHKLEGNANLTMAYEKAFKTLKAKRDASHCTASSTQGCNQLIMVITDYVPGDLHEVFDKHNRETEMNVTYIPVRVFTYLIGKEVTNVKEIQEMACTNRGYFVHIHSIEEVQQQVLKYINVIARPMILAKEEPPPTWTHANIDYTRTSLWAVSSDVKKPDEDKLVTSVAIPAFDLKYKDDDNDATLLGVAGTDVPIDSIAKLAQPHQLGVNGYSFIVSNNGYLLLHPLLITTINNALQANYNSVDFVEVEQVDDGNGPRVLGEEIQTLRQKLVDGEEGSVGDIKVLFHYDNMRRIARVKHDYFFNKLEGTPFSMGISLPKGYGDTELLLKDNPLEAKQGKELTGINVTDYFRFSYRVHPDWVYCKYHYLEGHESDNSEEEIWSFLVRLSNNEIDIMKKQYIDDEDNRPFKIETHCGNATTQLQKDDYYCNEDLVKQLVFDAKLTTPFFKDWNVSDEHRRLAEMYNVSVRFISTASGLTRWHYIFNDTKNEVVDDQGNRHKVSDEEVFGDKYYNAIEETWYKAAVLQHMINKDSIVIATPLPILDKIMKRDMEFDENGDIVMTASYAIFYKDGKSETPASVVGFEFSFLSFQKRFLHITGKSSDPSFHCNNPDYDCFIVDSSGYVVMSRNKEDVGRFLGAVERNEPGMTNAKRVLSSLLDKHVFDHVEVFNYQALCPPEDLKVQQNSAWHILTPFNMAANFFRWLMAEFILLLANFGSLNWDVYANIASFEDYDLNSLGITEPPTTTTLPPPTEKENKEGKEDEKKPFSCDHRISLYILNQTKFLDPMGEIIMEIEDEPGKCHPRYWAAYMKETNLLLVVIENQYVEYSNQCVDPPTTEPEATDNSTTSGAPCHKLDLAGLPRRRLEGCFTYHEGERNITACGKGNVARADHSLFTAAVLAAVFLAGRW